MSVLIHFSLIFACASLVAASVEHNRIRQCKRWSCSVVGEVVAVSGPDKDALSYAAIRFSSETSQQIEFHSGGSAGRYKVGQAVRVLYPPNHPENAVLDSLDTFGFRLPVFISVAAFFSLVALVTTFIST